MFRGWALRDLVKPEEGTTQLISVFLVEVCVVPLVKGHHSTQNFRTFVGLTQLLFLDGLTPFKTSDIPYLEE